MGRERELEALASLFADGSGRRFAFIHGSGGAGKTTLLKELARAVSRRGISVSRVDLRDAKTSPHEILSLLAIALEVHPSELFEADIWGNPRHLLVLDSYEAAEPADDVLRDAVLAKLPAQVRVAIASRRPPNEQWRSDPEWRALTEIIALGALSREESREYLIRREIHAGDQEAALDFANGHPLALTLTADVITAAPGRPFRPEAAPAMLHELVRRLVEHPPSLDHQHALELCALARTTNEAMLGEVLGIADPRPIFDWLCRLSIVEMDQAGLYLHAIAREAILAHSRWRDRDRLASLRRRALTFYISRFDRHHIPEQQRSLADAAYVVHRELSILRAFVRWTGVDQFIAAGAAPADKEELRALVARHEGETSASIAIHWLEAQPESTTVLRNEHGGLEGICSFVSLEHTTAEERARDPVACAIWSELERRGCLDGVARITLNRHWMTRDGYQSISAGQSACLGLVARHHYTNPRISHFFGVFSAPALIYSPLFAFTGFERISSEELGIDGRRLVIVGRDWRKQSPLEWFNSIFKNILGGPVEVATEASGANAEPSLSQHDFSDAVARALHSFHEPHELENNVLLETRMVRARAGASEARGDRVRALRTVLVEAVAELPPTKRGEKHKRAIRARYLEPVGTLEDGAASLEISVATYRRHIQDGVEELALMFWSREK